MFFSHMIKDTTYLFMFKYLDMYNSKQETFKFVLKHCHSYKIIVF